MTRHRLGSPLREGLIVGRPILKLAVGAGMVLTVLAPGCSSGGSGAPGTDSGAPLPNNDASPEDAPANGGLSLTPGSGKVLTCSQVQFTGMGRGSFEETSTSVDVPGTFTVTGSVSETGLYTAPISSPVGPGTSPTVVTVSFYNNQSTVSSVLTMGTAFLGTPAVVTTATDSNANGTDPFEHRFSASANYVYAAFNHAGAAVLSTDIYASTDGGKTFGSPTNYKMGYSYHGGTVAVDPVHPEFVYLAYSAMHGDTSSPTGSTVRLAVSGDGAATFKHEYAVLDTPGTNDSIAAFVHPDVAATSAAHLIVVGGIGGTTPNNTPYAWVATFISRKGGMDIGPESTPETVVTRDGGVSELILGTDTNSANTLNGCSIDGGAGTSGPRVFSNGKSAACIVYRTTGAGTNCVSIGVQVQCSTNDGAQWTKPTLVGSPNNMGGGENLPTGAISPGGNVAVTWIDGASGKDEVMLAISKDFGSTFSPAIKYPSGNRVAATAPGAYTGHPVVQWQDDATLWLAQTLDGNDSPTLLVDKTCDYGKTWSGWVNAGGYEGSSLVLTPSGMVAGGWGTGDPMPQGQIITLPLAQGTL